MKRNLTYVFVLCLLTFYACEQQNINPTDIVDESYENALSDREVPLCDLTQIPLYIPPAEVVQGNIIDFSTIFPVTESSEYESINGDITIQQLSYLVNNSSTNNNFEYQNNVNYDLTINVRYSINDINYTETFSLCFEAQAQPQAQNKELIWKCTNYCEYHSEAEAGALDSRSAVATLILP